MRRNGSKRFLTAAYVLACATACGASGASQPSASLAVEQPAQQALVAHGQPIVWASQPSFCLGTAGNKQADGTQVVLQACTGSAGQSWTTRNGQLNIFGNKCLDVKDGQKSNGTKLQIWTCDGNNTHQKWTSSAAVIKWASQNLCVDVLDGVVKDGQPVQMWSCDGNNTNQQFAASGAVVASTSPTTPAGATVMVNGMQQGGSGWTADINKAASSAQYQALTLDQLKAKKCELSRQLARHPDVEAAIRKVSKATGVPDGLLAGVAYQESTFKATATSGNPNPTSQDTVDVGLMQCPKEDFQGNSWQDPETNISWFVTKYFLPAYRQNKSWGMALRLWNSGQGHTDNLRWQNNNTDANYIDEILGRHCMGLD